MNPADHAPIVAKSLHNRLSTDLGVQSELGSEARLYDFAPDDPVFPYLTYGSMRSDDISGDDCTLYEHTLSLHIWSRYAGRAEILSAIAAVSHAITKAPLVLASGECVSARVVFTDHFRAPDGRTLHGIVRLIVVTQI